MRMKCKWRLILLLFLFLSNVNVNAKKRIPNDNKRYTDHTNLEKSFYLTKLAKKILILNLLC